MTSIGYTVGLAIVWVLLWGSASAANVLSGLSVGLLLAVVVPDLRRRNRWPTVRPIPLAKLVVVMLINIVRANIVLTREIITPRSQLRTGVVGVALPTCSDELVTLITNLLGTVPGTMPLELMEDPRVLYVHVLHLDDADGVRDDVVRLTGLAVRAFGSREAIAEMDSIPDGTAVR
ncbi:Na+/H+ antiporter subunit E [soil metagenome]